MNPEHSAAETASRDPARLRCRQLGVTRDRLDKEIASFETCFRDLPPYGPHLRWWIARYSRGDGKLALREAFAEVVGQVDRDGHDAVDREGDGALLFAYSGGFIGPYRDALVLLSIARCLHLPESARALLRWCERGDALIETLAQANRAPRAEREVPPPFPDAFDGLYAALGAATSAAAADAVRAYLRVWLDDRMDGMGFKVSDEGLCYRCFEAAGVVAALRLDDGAFAGEPVYPAELAAFAREGA